MVTNIWSNMHNQMTPPRPLEQSLFLYRAGQARTKFGACSGCAVF